MTEDKIYIPEIEFLKFIENLLKKADYDIQTQSDEIDVIAKKAGMTYAFEIKFSEIVPRNIDKIYRRLNHNDWIPVIITVHEVSEEGKREYINRYKNLRIIDISNLLYIVNEHEQLKNELLSILPFSVDNIFPKESFISLDILEHSDNTVGLLEELKFCESGKKGYRTYEEVCYSILKSLFAEDLSIWRKQSKSNHDLYRFDLLCRVKEDNQKTFWSIIENYFKSKYIVFEFKNYSTLVTQKDIYTTERYLYTKALRSVGIIITTKGYHENAQWAAKGCLRENGKLILLLTNKDLEEMVNKKNKDESPADYLLNKLDDILLELEK